jgi:hypothetical protein
VIALPVLLGLLLGAAPLAAEGRPEAATRVAIETFVVGLGTAKGEVLEFARREGELTGGVNPDIRARELAGKCAGEVTLIHSTSWRWMPDGRIVLTYVAWAKDGTLSPGARVLPDLKPPGPTDPLHPRPSEIRELDPLAHGLRHIAFLLRTSHDGAVAAALGPRSAAALARVEPDVAGELVAP